MAIIKWDDDGQEFYVPDALLYAGDPQAAFAAAIPLVVYQAQQRLAALEAQLENFAAPTDGELLEFARQTHPAYLARRQISDQIDLAKQELAQWPSR